MLYNQELMKIVSPVFFFTYLIQSKLLTRAHFPLYSPIYISIMGSQESLTTTLDECAVQSLILLHFIIGNAPGSKIDDFYKQLKGNFNKSLNEQPYQYLC